MSYKGKKEDLAKVIHIGNRAIASLEIILDDLLMKYYEDITNIIEYKLRFDDYDNSVEVDFRYHIPYPWEPDLVIREEILKHGFSTVFWNFIHPNPDPRKFETLCYYEEIRGFEPRRFKKGPHTYIEKIGYVDERFNLEEWSKQYQRKS